MSGKDKKRQEPSWWLIGLMSATGILLVVWIGNFQAEWLPSPGVAAILAKANLMAWSLACLAAASLLLGLKTTSKPKKAVLSLANGLAVLLAALFTVPIENPSVMRIAILAALPLYITLLRPLLTLVVRPSMLMVKQEWRPLSLVALGLAAYAGSIIVATSSLGSRLADSIGLTAAIICVGVVGILGLAIAFGVYIGALGKRLRAGPPRP